MGCWLLNKRLNRYEVYFEYSYLLGGGDVQWTPPLCKRIGLNCVYSVYCVYRERLIFLEQFIKFSKGFTHGGNFHADDVFSAAFLLLLNPNMVFERGFDVPKGDDYIVFDIGNGEFDHHGANREKRHNGRFYAAFGKLWRKYADLLVSEYVKEVIDENFISIIDHSDNTSETNPLSNVIYDMNPFWDEEADVDAYFADAVQFAYKILKRVIAKYQSIEKARNYVLECFDKSQNGIVIMEEYAPWYDTLKDAPVKAIVFPSNRGGWNIERIENSGFEFPREWWGTREEKVKGLLFCHASGFMCNFRTLEDIKDYFCLL